MVRVRAMVRVGAIGLGFLQHNIDAVLGLGLGLGLWLGL